MPTMRAESRNCNTRTKVEAARVKRWSFDILVVSVLLTQEEEMDERWK